MKTIRKRDKTDLDGNIKTLTKKLKTGGFLETQDVAIDVLDILIGIVTQKEWKNAKELMTIIREEGKNLTSIQPSETVIGNMVRRVLKIIREEYVSAKGKTLKDDPQDALPKRLLTEGVHEDYTGSVPNFDMETVTEAIEEVKLEMESSIDNISEQALEHIHNNEVILTTGKSKTLLAFFKSAARKRKFKVMVVEGAPFFHGQEMAKKLASANIETTLITDSAVFAIMSRVNKVIIGTHTVLANGGLKVIQGGHSIALAAKYYSVPLVVVAAMSKLSSHYLCSYDQDAFNRFLSPSDVVKFSDSNPNIEIYNPAFDYVPPELVTLFISNIGGNAPSYVYRLLSELYHPDDNDL